MYINFKNNEHFIESVSLNEIIKVQPTPFYLYSQKKIESDGLMKTTESAIMDDRFVKQLINDFGAEVIASSIKPIKKKEK